MAIGLRAVGAWAEFIANGSVTIPGSPQDGDRMFLIVAWKDFARTLSGASGWTLLNSAADGSVASGNGTGSVKIACYSKDWVSGDTNPALTWNLGPEQAAGVIMVLSKASNEVWSDLIATVNDVFGALSWTTTPTTSNANATRTIPDNSCVIGIAGIRDDSATFTRPTTGIDAAGVTWNGNYVESPATHGNFTTGADGSYDSGYRLVATGGAGITLTATGTLSAAETGQFMWIIQGVTAVAPTAPRPNQYPQLLAH